MTATMPMVIAMPDVRFRREGSGVGTAALQPYPPEGGGAAGRSSRSIPSGTAGVCISEPQFKHRGMSAWLTDRQ